MRSAISPKHRYPSGEIHKDQQEPRKETPEQVRAQVVGQRIKFLGATPDNAMDQLWEHPLGRMRMWSIIAKDNGEGLSKMQAVALGMFLGDYCRAYGMKGLPRMTIAALDYGKGAMGLSVKPEPEEKDVLQAESDCNSARAALTQYPVQFVTWTRLLIQLSRREGDDGYWRRQVGELRGAANVLARHYGLYT